MTQPTDSGHVRPGQPHGESLLLKPHEAAAALAISPRKLWELTNMGELPCVRIGRSLRYPREALRTWIERRQGRQP